MGRKMISIYNVCEMMIESRHWRADLSMVSADDRPQDRVTYQQFEDFLIGREVTTSPRRCREIWKYLRTKKLGVAINQSDTMLIDLRAIIEFVDNRGNVQL